MPLEHRKSLCICIDEAATTSSTIVTVGMTPGRKGELVDFLEQGHLPCICVSPKPHLKARTLGRMYSPNGHKKRLLVDFRDVVLAVMSLCILLCLGVGLYCVWHDKREPVQRCDHHEMHREPYAHLPKYRGPPVEQPDRYTMILSSRDRLDLLQRSLAWYSRCQNIDSIRVVWDMEGLPPSDPSFLSPHKEVRYDIVSHASLNNRFLPLEGLRTAAVFNVDDDVYITCKDLDRAFEVWKQQPKTLTGFFPRLHQLDSTCRWKYAWTTETIMVKAKYSMILTKAAFLHRDYLEVYSHHMPKELRETVDRYRNCEDIAMQFLVANATRTPPVFVHSSWLLDLGKGFRKHRGISSQSTHGQFRTQCLNEFSEYYNNTMPLVTRSLAEDGPLWYLRLTPILDFIVAFLRGNI